MRHLEVFGKVGVLIGISFFFVPEMLALFISLFCLLRGADLIIMGANSGKYFL